MTDPGTAWIERAYRELAARGHRSGGARSLVIEHLGRGDACSTAAELRAELREAGSPVGTASVYRALTVLQDAGLVRSLDLGDGERRWELVHADGAHHHHVVCDRCGRTVAFTDPELERAIDGVARRLRAQVDAHDVVLHGACERCAGR
jgi:Fur family ferric uptake transcriptional regulator